MAGVFLKRWPAFAATESGRKDQENTLTFSGEKIPVNIRQGNSFKVQDAVGLGRGDSIDGNKREESSEIQKKIAEALLNVFENCKLKTAGVRAKCGDGNNNVRG